MNTTKKSIQFLVLAAFAAALAACTPEQVVSITHHIADGVAVATDGPSYHGPGPGPVPPPPGPEYGPGPN